jgi:hypothetical protein
MLPKPTLVKKAKSIDDSVRWMGRVFIPLLGLRNLHNQGSSLYTMMS